MINTTKTNIFTNLPATRTQTKTTTCQTGCPCPECGSLECLCRPRFFDGQLLSADDLTRLENYIVKKNRLHNRYLNGWGVVAGLEVVCHACKDQVVVRPGYALSPCGDDIQVCDEVAVPICDLINQCRPSRSDDCYSTGLTPEEAGCADAQQDWILMICYDEKPSRGITPLRNTGGSACCSKCNCGGSSSCGCGCHDRPASTSKVTTSSRYGPAQCEPSLICEGYRFEVQRVTPALRKNQKLTQGAIVERFLECYRELAAVIPDMPTDLSNLDDLQQFCCDIRDSLREFFYTHSTYNCLLDERLALVICPTRSNYSTDADFKQALTETFKQEVLIVTEYLKYCMCSILLPPVDDPVQENCVPLATVTINSADCHILEVCNLDSRKFAITVPTLSYWMSWLPIGQLMRNLTEKLCCPPIKDMKWNFTLGDYKYQPKDVKMKDAYAAPQDAPQAAPAQENAGNTQKIYSTPSPSRDATTIFANAWTQRANSIDLQAMILDAFGATDAQGQPFMTDAERRNPLTAMLANQLGVPMVESFIPSSLKGGLNAKQANSAPSDMETLKTQVANLNDLVMKQQATIDKLSKKQAKKG
ncbi:MAG TPA: hypothetical protein VMC09_11530 [Anaerolineales bacterium]|nr:hypothetical protein [Anaerolineales bacterium]